MYGSNFPTIKNISDVLPYIEGWDEFRLIDNGWYKTVNYMVSMENTFSIVNSQSVYGAKIRRECRGLIFDAETGNILSRPYHKFFNVNEKQETDANKINLYESHTVLEKLDGSMIRQIPTDDGFRLATKAGITDISVDAENFIQGKNNYHKFIQDCVSNNQTAIFEWVSPQNRIVVHYDQNNLILTAIRDLYTGEYVNYDKMVKIASNYSIPVVNAVDNLSVQNIQLLIKQVREWDYNNEGVVIRFDTEMYKVKSDDYCLLHKTKEQISSEKNVISLILNDGLDDVIPILLKSDVDRLYDYQTNFWSSVSEVSDYLTNLFKIGNDRYSNDKDFAVNFVNTDLVHDNYKHFMFKMRKTDSSARDLLIDMVKNNLSTQAKVDKIRWIWKNAKWN